jgi:hypothetical protein
MNWTITCRGGRARLGKIRGRLPQDLVGPLQLTDVALQLFQPLALAGRQPRPIARVTLRLPDPLTKRLG